MLLLVSILAVSNVLAFDSEDKKINYETMKFPYKLKSAKRYRPLNKHYKTKKGWIGADGAYSIPVSKTKTLWTYGDTWIGVIKNGKRVKPKMINNTVSLQNLTDNSMSFSYRGSYKRPKSVWVPGPRKTYYWPADGVSIDGKLMVFLHKIRTNKKLPPPFQFECIGDDLSIVSNPLEPIKKWHTKKIVLTKSSKKIHYATACLNDKNYVYVYSNYAPAKKDLNPHPLIVSRIKKEDLLKGNVKNIEHYSTNKSWEKDLKDPKILFMDGAPEMSVGRVKGIAGYIALYMPPLTKKIVVRHSMKPEGPWSKPLCIFNCPEVEDYIILYSAKMHQELVTDEMPPGTLVVTYCRNTKGMQEHIDKPEIYYPQALKIELAI